MSDELERKALDIIERVESLVEAHAHDAWEMAQRAVQIEAVVSVVTSTAVWALLAWLAWKVADVVMTSERLDKYDKGFATTIARIAAGFCALLCVLSMGLANWIAIFAPDVALVLRVL